MCPLLKLGKSPSLFYQLVFVVVDLHPSACTIRTVTSPFSVISSCNNNMDGRWEIGCWSDVRCKQSHSFKKVHLTCSRNDN